MHYSAHYSNTPFREKDAILGRLSLSALGGDALAAALAAVIDGDKPQLADVLTLMQLINRLPAEQYANPRASYVMDGKSSIAGLCVECSLSKYKVTLRITCESGARAGTGLWEWESRGDLIGELSAHSQSAADFTAKAYELRRLEMVELGIRC